MDDRPSASSALLWAAAMGAFFFLVYGGANAFTAARDNVPSLFFDWERNIPFIPWMIAPYMSLDLLFAGAFWVCPTRKAVKNLAGRIAFCIVLSAIFFIALPLRFAFTKPEATGLSGLLFDLLALDLPYNQFPSLHVSLSLVVGMVYFRAVRGWLRTALFGWFFLIAVSTLFTYQHHLIDLIGGTVAGLLALWAMPAHRRRRTAVTAQHWRMAARYWGLAAVLLGTAALWQGWGWLLLWPALSCFLLGLAYATGDAACLAKTGGRHPLPIRILFLPYLAGAWCSWRFFQSFQNQDRPWTEAAPNVLLGRRLGAGEARSLNQIGVAAVLDLTPELTEPGLLTEAVYRHVPMLDLVPPDREQLQQAVRFIQAQTPRGKIYVHCALGCYRSALVVAEYLHVQGALFSPDLNGVPEVP